MLAHIPAPWILWGIYFQDLPVFQFQHVLTIQWIVPPIIHRKWGVRGPLPVWAIVAASQRCTGTVGAVWSSLGDRSWVPDGSWVEFHMLD